jgi:hypothetical protein
MFETRLYTTKQAPEGRTRAMSVEEVRAALDAVDFASSGACQ